MATIKVVFREATSKSGEGSLSYRIIHRRVTRQIHCGYRIMKTEWDSAACSIRIDIDSPRAAYLNEVRHGLEKGLSRLSHIVMALDKEGTEYSAADVVARYQAADTVVGFLSFARRHIAEKKRSGKDRLTEHYTTALNSLIRFNGEAEIPFRDFTGELMQRYESHLSNQGLCPNSVSYYMRNLRALYNQAVEHGFAVQTHPFRHVYTGIAKTVKRAVTLTTIKRLRDMDFCQDPLSALARDLFLFSFCTRGMAIIDIAYLRKSDLKNGVLTYRRQKTGQQLSIKWEARMQEIINRHTEKDSDFLFPLIHSAHPDYHRQYLTSYRRMIRRLRLIGEQLGLTEPLTFHRSRHAWASIARDHNVPLAVISEGMGHDSEKTTRIYLASLDTSILDNANRDIMNLLDT